MIDPSIFRQYDIRGVWGRELTPESAALIGRAFGSKVFEATGRDRVSVSVGRDVRLSSPALSAGLIKGINATGADVMDIGECPTPVQYFSLYHLPVDAGVMLTGSHNPPEYNGFKMSIGKETLYGAAIQDLRMIIGGERFREGSGNTVYTPVTNDYASYLRKAFMDLSGIRVVVDAGNGTAGLVAPDLLSALGADVVTLFCEPDGNFPNHHPDPVVEENLVSLMKTVKASGAHLGIAYDGDSDRLGVVAADGEIVWGDRLMIIFSRDLLRHFPGATIIGEVKCSQVMYDDIRKHGGNPVMWKTGHSLIKKKMKEEKALLAGEMSGHMFFADRYFGYDDAIYATLRLLEIMKKNGPPYDLKRLLSGLPEVFSTPEIRIDCDDSRKFGVVENIREMFSDYEVNTTDGARIIIEDGWALIRASNTQPVLVLRFEAGTEDSLRRIRTFVEEKLRSILS